MYCDKCGEALEGNSRFCDSCGHALVSAATQQQLIPILETTERSRWVSPLIIAVLAVTAAAIAVTVLYDKGGAGVAQLTSGVTRSSAPLFSKVPTTVWNAVVNSQQFKAPVVIGVCNGGARGDAAKWQQTVENYLSAGGLPPVFISSVCQKPRLTQLLISLGYIGQETMFDRLNNTERKFFYFTDKLTPYISSAAYLGFGETAVNIAERSIGSVDYTNSYKINPLGTGERQVVAFTFSYSFRTTMPGMPDLSTKFKGKATAVLDPEDGEWKLDSLQLLDKGGEEYFAVIG